MAGFRRRINCALSGVFSEKRLFIQSDGGTRYFRITPLSQLMIGTTALAAAGWMAVATASVVSDFVATDARGGAAVELREAYQARLDELADERDTRAAEAHSAQGRFRLAMDQVSRQQTELLAAIEERRELSTALDLMRDRLRSVVAQRDSANTKLLAEAKAGGSGDDLDETLRAWGGCRHAWPNHGRGNPSGCSPTHERHEAAQAATRQGAACCAPRRRRTPPRARSSTRQKREPGEYEAPDLPSGDQAVALPGGRAGDDGLDPCDDRIDER